MCKSHCCPPEIARCCCAHETHAVQADGGVISSRPLSAGWTSSVLSSAWFLNLTDRLRTEIRAALKLSTEVFRPTSVRQVSAKFSSAQHTKPLLCLALGATVSTAADPASWSLHILVPQLALGPIAYPVLLSLPWPLCDLMGQPATVFLPLGRAKPPFCEPASSQLPLYN